MGYKLEGVPINGRSMGSQEVNISLDGKHKLWPDCVVAQTIVSTYQLVPCTCSYVATIILSQ